jgi:hypothetical protein
MTKPNAATTQQGPKPGVIVFGRDKEKRPIAAQFPEKLSILAIKAAAQLQLATIMVTTPPIEAIARLLPMGRIHANGQGVVPVVKDPLFEQVALIAKGGTPALPSAGVQTPRVPVPKNEAGREGNSAGTKGLPGSWKEIAVGNLVLAQESLLDGWWECVVVKRDKDMLTLRWRDYGKYQPFLCHVDAVALLNASPGFDH